MFNFQGIQAQLNGNNTEVLVQWESGYLGKTNLENRFRIRPAGVLDRSSIERGRKWGRKGKDSRFEKAHRGSENRKSHPLVQLPRCLWPISFRFRLCLPIMHQAVTNTEHSPQLSKISTK